MEPSRCRPGWVPASLCRLPIAEQPGREQEFDALFADRLTGVERLTPQHVRFRLTGGLDLLRRAQDLAHRETACCSFLTFDLAHDDRAGEVVVDVRVPSEQTGTLAALAERAVVGTHSGTLRAGEVARAGGVHRQTLRYYERRGLIAEPDRSPGGHRRYPPETVTRLRAIKAAQRLGFTLDEVATLIEPAGRRPPHDVGLLSRAEAKLVEVDARLADLTRLRAQLVAAVDAGCDDLLECAGRARADQGCCPIPFAAPTAG